MIQRIFDQLLLWIVQAILLFVIWFVMMIYGFHFFLTAIEKGCKAVLNLLGG